MAKKAKPSKTSTAADSVVKELKSTVKQLRTSLEQAEAKVAKWKAAAKQYEAAAVGATKQLAKTTKALEKARRAPVAATKPAAPTPVAPTPTAGSDLPDESWTVTRLRATARARGVAGYSRMSKADLIDALKA